MNITSVAVALISPSPSNPRTIPSKEALTDLVNSVREIGILNPLTLRLMHEGGGGYIVVCGHRRLAAAKAAGLTEVPAIIRDLSDEEADELAIVDNLQREDLSPLEEAAAYKELQKTRRYDLATLSKAVAKSRQYVAQRLSLLDLHPKLQKELASGRILLGDAMKLSRLDRDDQMDMLDDASQPMESSERLVARLGESLISLSSAPWKMHDDNLAGKDRCDICSARTSQKADLFPEVAKGDHCLDGKCFAAKLDAFITRLVAEEKKAGRNPVKISEIQYYSPRSLPTKESYRIAQKGCAHPQTGIIVEGKRLGRKFTICMDPKCKACWKGAARSTSSSSSASHSQTPQDRYKRRMEIWNNRVEQEYREQLYRTLVPMISTPVQRIHLVALLVEIENRNHGSIQEAAELIGKKWSDRIIADTDFSDFNRKMRDWADNDIFRLIFALVLQQELVRDPLYTPPEDILLTQLFLLHVGNKIDRTVLRSEAVTKLLPSKPKPPKEEEEKKPAAKVSKPKKKPAEDPDEAGDAMRPSVSGRRKKAAKRPVQPNREEVGYGSE
jgi:ParB/RepB/Spo0J family partition protein